MSIRNASAVWNGSLQDGNGTMRLGGGAFEGAYSFASRFQEGQGTNPEELIAAAHAGCFSMALAHGLDQQGMTPRSIATTAKVRLEKTGEGFSITRIELVTEGEVPGADGEAFRRVAEDAKRNCPVSRLMAGADISLEARLLP